MRGADADGGGGGAAADDERGAARGGAAAALRAGAAETAAELEALASALRRGGLEASQRLAAGALLTCGAQAVQQMRSLAAAGASGTRGFEWRSALQLQLGPGGQLSVGAAEAMRAHGGEYYGPEARPDRLQSRSNPHAATDPGRNMP